MNFKVFYLIKIVQPYLFLFMNTRQLFLNHLAQTSGAPLMLEIEKAEGVFMYDKQGREIIDLISGIGVSNVGHRHPNVMNAIHEQSQKYLHLMVYGEFVQAPQVRLAAALCETLPDPLSSIYFVNSGSEAVEGAVKLAKRYTGRQEIISFRQAYHGSTQGALSLNGDESIKRNFRPLIPCVKHLEYNHIEALSEITSRTAAVIIETIQGEAGVRIPHPDYLPTLARICQKKGALLIVDEIQTGFGRTGKFWAFEHYHIIPDIVVSAKGMGGGMPIGAFISSKEIMSVLTTNPILGHITTFGGHPLSCAASLATLETILNEKLMEKVESKAALFRDRLQHPAIRSIRDKGLMMAVEFDSFAKLKPIIDTAIKLGVLTDWFLFNDNSMRVAPPLIISEDEIHEACDKLLEAIERNQ